MKKFKLVLLAFAVMIGSSYTAHSQSQLGGLLNKIPKGGPSSSEMGVGIKQALEAGIARGADQLSAKDGFLGNPAVKILFPPEAQKIEKTLRSLGLGSLADNVITSLNRAAEDAAKDAKPIFLSAIKQMTIADATNIVLGDQNSATEYFRRATTAQLLAAFTPVITASLNKVGATKYWSDATHEYNKLPLVKKVNTDLPAYTTQKAIDGMFIQVALEELKIRNELGARSTPVLQKVFGYADKNRN